VLLNAPCTLSALVLCVVAAPFKRCNPPDPTLVSMERRVLAPLLLAAAALATAATPVCKVEAGGWTFDLSRANNGQYAVVASRSDGHACAPTGRQPANPCGLATTTHTSARRLVLAPSFRRRAGTPACR